MKNHNHRTRKLLTLLITGIGVCWVEINVAQAQPDLLVTNPQGPNIRRFGGQTGAFVGDFVTTSSGGLLTANGMVFGPDGNLYVTDGIAASSSTILRYDGDTGAFIDVFVMAGSGGLFAPQSAVFGPDGNLYVPTHQGDSVVRYDDQTAAFIDAFVPAGGGGVVQHYGGLLASGSGKLSDSVPASPSYSIRRTSKRNRSLSLPKTPSVRPRMVP